MAGVMTGIDWTAAKVLAEGVAQGGPWPQIARLLSQFEIGAIAGDAARHKKKHKENE